MLLSVSGLLPRRGGLFLPLFLTLIFIALWTSQQPRTSSFEVFRTVSSSSSSSATSNAALLPYVAPPPDPPIVDLSQSDAPFVGWPLRRVCDEVTTWVPGLVFLCDNNSGGVAHIRNYIQTCIRYALDAGATVLILPRIRKRSEYDEEHASSDLFTDFLPFSYMFDEAHFRAVFRAFCPRVAIYADPRQVPGAGPAPRIEYVTPKLFGPGGAGAGGSREVSGSCDWRDQNRLAHEFGPNFRRWLQQQQQQPQPQQQHQHHHHDHDGQEAMAAAAPTTGDDGAAVSMAMPTRAKPRFFRLTWGVLWEWPVHSDGPEFAATFGGLLRFNERLLRLGQVALRNMRYRAFSQGGAEDGGFLGVHQVVPHGGASEEDSFFISRDADTWPSVKSQSEIYLRQAVRRGYHAAYLASSGGGNASSEEGGEARRHLLDEGGMAGAAAVRSIPEDEEGNDDTKSVKVFTKADLLEGEDLAEMRALSRDQRAIVDAVVLLGADYFVGAMPSSYSAYLAQKRHLRTGGLYARPYRAGKVNDELSLLVGNFSRYWDGGLYMFDGMWP